MTPYPYQADSIRHLIRKWQHGYLGLADLSDCGIGKTLVGVEVMKAINLPTVVVCPTQTIAGWERTAAAQGTELSVINWEMLRTGRTPYGEFCKLRPEHRKLRFKWAPEVKAVIFDEAHRAQSFQSKQSDLVRAARRQGIFSLALSATLAEDPLDLDAMGYLLRLHDSSEDPEPGVSYRPFWSWARSHGCGKGAFSALEFKGTKQEKDAVMEKIHATIIPDRGVRVKISDLGDQFPATQITAELYSTGNEKEITACYQQMAPFLAEIEELEKVAADSGQELLPVTEALRAWQKLELLKVPILVELCNDAVAQGMSCPIFVTFRATLEALAKELQTDCIIDGSQVGAAGRARREANRMRFQRGESRVILVVSTAGGLGLDLHDEFHNFQRLALILLGHDGKLLMQLFGRVRRAGGTKSLQRIVLAANTPDEDIYKNVQPKLDRISRLNDGAISDSDLILRKL